MTLQQLKYVIAIAETGTITEAAARLFISQPSLTNAVHELEKEMGIRIFNRTNKGISLSREGEDFLGYTVCSGVIDESLNGRDIIAVPLAEESDMRIGYITHRKGMVSRLGATYLDALKKYIGVEKNGQAQPERKLERRGRFKELGKNGEMICEADKIVKEHMREIEKR